MVWSWGSKGISRSCPPVVLQSAFSQTQPVPEQPRPSGNWPPTFAQEPGLRGNYEGSQEAPLPYGEESG